MAMNDPKVSVRKDHQCPRCGALVYLDTNFFEAVNICTGCGRGHAPGSRRDSLDRQFNNYKEVVHDASSRTYITGTNSVHS